MAIVTHPQMLTANRLSDGEIVWWAQGGWVEMLAEGQVFAGADEAEAALQAAKAFVE
jgi:sulfite reductase (NADPH) hemoprotein beta-component